MGNNEAATPVKAEKAQPAIQSQEQPVVHPFPDWAAMQAYYGPGMMPPPYFAPTVAPGHAHPYMWGPQPMIPPFGSPYAAIYPPGGVYPHPAMSIGIVPSPAASEAVVMATPLSMEMQPKSSGNKDRGSAKKHKGLDGLAIGNGSTENTGGADGNVHSQSGYNSAEGSTEGSDGNNASGGTKSQRKRNSDDVTASGNTIGTVTPSCPVPSMDLRVAAASKAKAISTHLSPANGATVTHRGGSEHWMQDERELKRERRKQSNRESARRSRLRKQAETEELAIKVEALTSENANIRAEISQLIESSEKLRIENSALMEKLKNPRSVLTDEDPDKVDTHNAPCVVENILSIIDNPNSSSREQQKDDSDGKTTSRLHQLLDPGRRTDAVAAS